MSSLKQRLLVPRANFLPGWFPGAVSAPLDPVQAFPVIEATNISNVGGLGGTNPHAVALPASITAGELLLIFITIQWGGAITLTTPSGGWNPLYNVAGGGDLRRFAAYYKVASGSEGATVSVSASGACRWSASSCRISGYQGNPEAGTTATGSSANPNPPSLAPTWGSAKTLWLAVEGDIAASSTTPTPPTNYIDQVTSLHFTNPFRSRTAFARRELEAASDDPGTFTIGASGQWAANTVAIRPA